MIFDLFIVGGYAFWILICIVSGILFYAVNDERDHSGFLATFVAIVTFLALWLFGSFSVFSWTYHNPRSMLIYLGCYFAGGVIWSFIKWYIFNSKLRRKFEEIKQEFLNSNEITADQMTEDQSRRWTEGDRREFAYSIGNRDGSIIPKASTHKGLLTMWMTYWPISLIKTLLRDAVHELWETIFAWFHGVLQSVSDRKFAHADLPIVKNDRKSGY